MNLTSNSPPLPDGERVGVRAGVYELMSRLLSAPAAEHGEQALHLAFTLSRTPEISERFQNTLIELVFTLARTGIQEIEREWQASFALTDGGPLSLCETEYGMAHIFQKSNTLADIAGFYKAFGLERAAGSERPDHLSIEFEFLGFLAAKQYHALNERRTELAEVSRAAEHLFLSEHVGQFCIGLFKRMADAGHGWPSVERNMDVNRSTRDGFYAAVARTGIAAFDWILAEHAISPIDQLPPMPRIGPDEPMTCGNCAAAADHG